MPQNRSLSHLSMLLSQSFHFFLSYSLELSMDAADFALYELEVQLLKNSVGMTKFHSDLT